MGIDYCYCEDCKECFPTDDFIMCYVCETNKCCTDCIDKYDGIKLFNKKKNEIIFYCCDKCISNKDEKELLDKILYEINNYGIKFPKSTIKSFPKMIREQKKIINNKNNI